jgi:hypothetical protein
VATSMFSTPLTVRTGGAILIFVASATVSRLYRSTAGPVHSGVLIVTLLVFVILVSVPMARRTAMVMIFVALVGF